MSAKSPANLRRSTIQQLESLKRSGVTHLPESSVATAEAANGILAATVPDPAAERRVPAPRQPHDSPRQIRAARTLFDEPVLAEGSSPVPRDSAATTEQRPMSREERCALLEATAATVAACRRCQELAETRTQTVFGVGNPQARIVFIGEAPGADEDRQGEPFVGRAGQLLNRIIAACRLTREEIYICNILKCRPPGNRTPAVEEANNCREYLDKQLAVIDPEYIVCWGSVAAQSLLGTTFSIGKMRGRFYQYGRARVVCTYHPSYLLRNPTAKKDVWEDMKFLMRDMGVELE